MSQKIVLCGCTESIFEVTDYLLSKNIKISYFVSLNTSQAEQYKVSGYHSFEELSEKYKVPIYYPKTYSLKDDDDVAFFKENKFDLLISGGWQRLIPEKVLQTLKIGGIGTHGSSEFLPKGRGRSTINWSIIEGKKRFILHIFLMTPVADAGDIIDYKIFDINEWDTCKTVFYKFSIIQKRMLENIIPKILENKFQRKPQRAEPSYYPKRTPEDGLIDWNKSAIEVYNFIRGLTKPYPGAFTYLNGNKIFIWNAQPFDTQIDYSVKKGQIVEKFLLRDFVVICGKDTLLVTDYEGEVNVGQVFSSKDH